MKKRFIRVIFSWLLRAIALTWRFHIKGSLPKSPAVVAFWHGTMLAVWKFFANTQSVGVTSLSSDGDALAMLLTSWKYDLIRGSSSIGGKEALERMTTAARTSLVLITPDGPKGPQHTFKPGAVIAASRAGSELVLCRVLISRKVQLSSWDAFEIPLPFTRIDLEFLPAIRIPDTASREEITAMIDSCEKALK